MLHSRRESLKPILDSMGGVRLTAYIKSGNGLTGVRRQLKEALLRAKHFLAPVMSPDETSHFLLPIQQLLEDGARLKNFHGNLGVFRTPSAFRILNIPIDVEEVCIVANTFHIKPLLRWMQIDREFVLLGLEKGSASLYQGSLHAFEKIDSIVFPTSIHGQKARSLRMDETMQWLNSWILSSPSKDRPTLFVAGETELTSKVLKAMRHINTETHVIWPSFSSAQAPEVCFKIRSILKAQAKNAFDTTLQEFHSAVAADLAQSNIFQIAKAAVQGRVKKLLIADGINVFGKLNLTTGRLEIYNEDLDHEDDDIFDDLAQTVLLHEGEVIVATRSELPKGRPILAIIEEPLQSKMAVKRLMDIETENHRYHERSAL